MKSTQERFGYGGAVMIDGGQLAMERSASFVGNSASAVRVLQRELVKRAHEYCCECACTHLGKTLHVQRLQS